MRKNLQNKILISLLAAGSLGLCGFANPAAAAATVNVDNNLITSHNNEEIANNADFNGYDYSQAYSDNEITVSGTTLNNFTGVGAGDPVHRTSLSNNNITLIGSNIAGKVTGVSERCGYPSANNITLNIINTNVANGITVADLSSFMDKITANYIKLSLEGNSEISGDVVLVNRGTWSQYSLRTQNNEIILKDTVNVENANFYAFTSVNNRSDNITSDDATLTIDGWSGKIGSLHDFDIINFDNIDFSNNNILDITGAAENMDNVAININSIGAGDYAEGKITSTISWDSDLGNNVTIDESLTAGKFDTSKYYIANRKSAEDGIYITKFTEAEVTDNNRNDNSVEISATIAKSILAGSFIDENGKEHTNTQTPNRILTIGDSFTTEVGTVAGVYAVDANGAKDGKVYISGKTNWQGFVYAGYSENGEVNNNTINVAAGTQAQSMDLSGSNSVNQNNADNTLNIAGNGSAFNSIERFDTINFDDVTFGGNASLSVTDADVDGTTINVNSLAGGQTFKAGDTQTLLSSANAITGSGEIKLANDVVTAGLTQDVKFSAAQSDDNKSIDLYVEGVSVNKQIDLVAENRAVAAAFVNQGTDLISDSLDTLSRDGNYGVKTFAAVHGNRSKYDVNSDLKINGWSTIVGVGSETAHNGGDFSWGVFYENGSGNYRTFNSFNNEFFRGDGSLVYNGGGIAARYENAHGVYTEGSLRAGMLKSEMDNALSDGENKYGYSSESEYYGAHIGIGQIIPLSENSDLDVYGKFFHTYTEGDSFNVAGDEFEFDSINSDRLRVGARITTNKANKFSTYYGLAYEYEFNGDAEMRAQNLAVPTQSLQGSSYMAELGFNYQPTPDSPWNFDLNMRGYAGEREGATFNVQATYTF